MPTKIGHFEILSELAKSPTGAVYKANDPQSGQTVALKAIQLSAFGESAAEVEKTLLDEVERTKVLSSSNITPIFGAGEMEGQFCAAMEYVQGNSIATMLARKEGFSIWDLLDIGRQVCGGLDHAHSNQVFHFNLEPAKIMCGWDGTVKILSFGVSTVGKFAHLMPAGVPAFLAYMSPEQVLGEAIDARSNLFTLGAIFYEMVTERKAFEGQDGETLRQSIVEGAPLPPIEVNPKVHPQLSELIMKALAKDPAHRYQRGRELLDDLEKCKESKPKTEPKPAAGPKGPAIPTQAKAAAQSKFIAGKSAQPGAITARMKAQSAQAANPPDATNTSAAAAAVGRGAASPAVRQADVSNQSAGSGVKPTMDASGKPWPSASSVVAAEPEVERFKAETHPKIAIDPLMAEEAAGGSSGSSFSEIDELPPLKEVYVAAQEMPSPPVQETASKITTRREPEKPKVQPREVAKKAIKEIQGVPPRLMLYSIAAAVVLILLIVIGFLIHVNHLNSADEEEAASRANAKVETPAESTPPAPVRKEEPPAPAMPAATAPSSSESATESGPASPAGTARNGRRKAARVQAPIIVPGQMFIDSTPPGAQVQIDGASDPRWVTPFTAPSLAPGQHSLRVSKAGYSPDARSVEIASGNRSTVMVHLAQLMATFSVKSDPPGANIYVDGRDTGKLTPAQVNVDKGQHTLLVRKLGYVDETTTAQFVAGQTLTWSPSLRALGNVDNIRTVGKVKKLFGGERGQGQVVVSIHTQPKGAQIAINQRMLDKTSPVEVMLDPGNYVIDISLTGYAPIHKVITADKGKVAIDETLQAQ
jgi:serine/threonine protein kinase